jgi:hypothetical protein
VNGIAEAQRSAALILVENGYLPAAHHAVERSGHPGAPSLLVAEGEFVNTCEHHAVSTVQIRDHPFLHGVGLVSEPVEPYVREK